jgi:FMN phosphatase YigB (HAD superfamily)
MTLATSSTTILFDLDGTLLPLRVDELLPPCCAALTRHWAPVFAEPARLAEHIFASLEVMIRTATPERLNAETYWADLEARTGVGRDVLRGPRFDAFYRDVFPRQRALYGDRLPGHGRALATAALDAGHDIVLATNPIWPRVAIEERMRWAGVHDLPWKLVTSMDDMHFAKPHPGYYAEICARIGRRPDECVLVGNDVEEDAIAGARAGLSVLLLTDHLENKRNLPLDGIPACTAAGLLDSLRREALPLTA